MKKQAGFTLLEIMLSLGLMVVLVLGASFLMRQAADIWNRSDTILSEVEKDGVAFNFVRKIIMSSKGIPWKNELDNQYLISFSGSENQVYFIAPLPVHNNEASGLYLFSFSLSGDALLASYYQVDWSSLEATLSSNPLGQEVLLDHVSSLSFYYYGVPDDEDLSSVESSDPNLFNEPKESIWQNYWQNRKRMPEAISINILRDSDDGVVRSDWRDLIIRLPYQELR